MPLSLGTAGATVSKSMKQTGYLIANSVRSFGSTDSPHAQARLAASILEHSLLVKCQ
jgi:hypothetical protein